VGIVDGSLEEAASRARGMTALRYTLHTEMDLARFSRAEVSGALEVRYDEELFTAGDAITFRRTLDPALELDEPREGDVAPMGAQAWSLIDGVVSEYSLPIEAMRTGDDASYSSFRATSGHYEIVDWQRATAELSAGYGLRWRTIEAETHPQDAGVMETGRLRIGPGDEANFRGIYDVDGVLREAEIWLLQDQVVRRLVVSTWGTVAVDDGLFAAHATATLRLDAVATDGGVELGHWTFDFQGFEQLSGETYKTVSEVSPPQGALTSAASSKEDERGGDGDGAESGGEVIRDSGLTETEDEQCEACKEEWVTQDDLLGGGECEHGPEHDTSAACVAAMAARADPLCVEAGGACECFTCHGFPYKDPFSLDCEGEIQEYVAWCQLGDPDLTCKTKPTRKGVKKKLVEQTPSGGACDGANGGMEQSTLCGSPENEPGTVTGACLATNCVSTGALQATQLGMLHECQDK